VTNCHCLILDLKDDPELIAQYEAHHRQVWPEVLVHIRAATLMWGFQQALPGAPAGSKWQMATSIFQLSEV
jgi:hypothetical protein